ncbi:CaiB/BaiF CoA-transferase family protein [Pseudonocardia thermophila]|uniref:CaiB/BaiF CoA-transferase family protein n=1 Tax=Pseudonocardia thermophila TaxID=1848 RepID=UPI00248E34D9|nr:CoA transferase [Pseudonocardia thermophila]
MSANEPGPLAGLRVVDCSREAAGARIGGFLADYGADVVRIEPPGGDPLRVRRPAEHAVFNRGKRCAELDLRSPDGAKRIDALLTDADVVVCSWRPGVAERLGLGYAQLHERHPHLVHVSVTGFGPSDVDPALPGYEALVHAYVGTMAEQLGHRPPPIFEALPFASVGAAHLALVGLLGALYRRSFDGIGRAVETSLVDGALAYLSLYWGDADNAQLTARTKDDYTTVRATRLVTGSFRCADDEYIGVHTGAVGGFDRLMRALGLDVHIRSSDGSAAEMGIRLTEEEKRILDKELPAAFLTKPRDHWVAVLTEADVCVVPQLRPGAVFDEEQTRVNGMVCTVDDPQLGPLEQVAPPIRFDRGPAPSVRGEERVPDPSALAFAGGPERERPWFAPGPPATGPLLDGVKILDLGAYFAGPYGSRLLADLGAQVVKLEPTSGDPLRGLAPLFRSAQAGKRSLAMDLKTDAGRRVLDHLVRWADVVHHNMRPGAAERLGVGAADVAAINPDAIYLYAPGWGSSGPLRDRQSFEPMISGYAGAGFEAGGQFNEPLYPLGNADPGGGLIGAVAMLTALLVRRREGRAPYVEVPQLNSALVHMAHIVRRAGDREVLNAGRLDPLQTGFSALERLYETADGWICVVAATEQEIAALSRATGVGFAALDRFSSPAARVENDYELAALLDDAFRTRPTEEWLAALGRAGVPAMEPRPYNNAAFLRDPANHRSRRVAECPHPTLGRVREFDQLLRVSDAAVVPHRLAPDLGAHSDEILAECGFAPEEIRSLREQGTVR